MFGLRGPASQDGWEIHSSVEVGGGDLEELALFTLLCVRFVRIQRLATDQRWPVAYLLQSSKLNELALSEKDRGDVGAFDQEHCCEQTTKSLAGLQSIKLRQDNCWQWDPNQAVPAC